MINLLSSDNQKKVLHSYREHLIMSYGIAVFLVMVIFLIALSSFYGALLIYRDSLKTSLQAEMGSTEAQQFNSYSTLIRRANDMVNILTTDDKKLHSPTTVLDGVLGARPAGIKLALIELSSSNNNWGLNLSGQAKSRQDILDFSSALGRDPLFSSVDSPFSNLIKDKNSDFVITATLLSKPK